MEKSIKIGLAILIVTIAVAVVILKPIVTNSNQYKVVMVNLSEHNVSSVTVSGAGEDSGKIGPIEPGKLRHFIFTPKQNGTLEYTVVQHEREIKGVVNDHLKIGDTGEVYVVVGEMHKVKIQNSLDI